VPNLSVDVELPPDSGPPTTEASSPSAPVVVVNPTAPSGDAFMGDLLARVTKLEAENEQLRAEMKATTELALSASIAATTDPEPEPEIAELEVPDSSDAGPEQHEEKPPPVKPAWHHWI